MKKTKLGIIVMPAQLVHDQMICSVLANEFLIRRHCTPIQCAQIRNAWSALWFDPVYHKFVTTYCQRSMLVNLRRVLGVAGYLINRHPSLQYVSKIELARFMTKHSLIPMPYKDAEILKQLLCRPIPPLINRILDQTFFSDSVD